MEPPGPVPFTLFSPVANHRLGVLAAIRSPIARMPLAPLAAGLNIVVPVVRVGGAPGLLPAALAFPLALSTRTELLPEGLRTGVKEFVTGPTTSLFHTRPLFD